MTFSQLYVLCQEKYGSQINIFELKELISFYARKPFSELLNIWNTEVNFNLEKFNKSLEVIIDGYPLAYITNQIYFYRNWFYIDKAVLIPRPETELLVKMCLEYLEKNRFKKLVHIFEPCTGSGNIIISIVKHKPRSIGVSAFATDISSEALDIAKVNASFIGAKPILFKIANFINSIDISNFNIIVSNPPYIDFKLKDKIAHAKYEPRIALFADNSGLWFYNELFQKVNQLAKENKLNRLDYIILEIGYDQKVALKKLYNMNQNLAKNFIINFHKDYNGMWRIITLERKR